MVVLAEKAQCRPRRGLRHLRHERHLAHISRLLHELEAVLAGILCLNTVLRTPQLRRLLEQCLKMAWRPKLAIYLVVCGYHAGRLRCIIALAARSGTMVPDLRALLAQFLPRSFVAVCRVRLPIEF